MSVPLLLSFSFLLPHSFPSLLFISRCSPLLFHAFPSFLVSSFPACLPPHFLSPLIPPLLCSLLHIPVAHLPSFIPLFTVTLLYPSFFSLYSFLLPIFLLFQLPFTLPVLFLSPSTFYCLPSFPFHPSPLMSLPPSLFFLPSHSPFPCRCLCYSICPFPSP